MKDAFFISDSYALTGPSIVNKYYREYLGEKYTFAPNETNHFRRAVHSLKAIVFHKAIVFSGASKMDRIFIFAAKLLGKKMIYIMHGCIVHENKINHVNNPSVERMESIYLKNADLVLAVSEQFAVWVKEKFPHVAHKVKTLTNGVDWSCLEGDFSAEKADENLISIVGGGVPRKNVASVCEAIDLLNREGYQFELKVFGRDDLLTEKVKSYSFVHYFGKIPRKEMLREIAQTSLFIQNSIFDSFALAPLEALTCGCSILCSKNVGALSLFGDLEENDVIEDCFDTQEIKQKILFVLENPNHDRLESALDKDQTSYEYRAKQLDEYIQQLIKA